MRISAAIATVAAIASLQLLGATAAPAAPLEAAGHFGGVLKAPEPPGNFPEEEQLGGTGGMAVNYTGAGGVAKGTVYVATQGPSGGTVRIAMFVPEEKGLKEGLEFSLGWEVTEAEGPYERCGPLLGINGEGKAEHPCPIRVEASEGKVDVDIDQNTGNVYVYNGTVVLGLKAIAVYDPTGSEVITRFGEFVNQNTGNPIPVSPDKIHSSPFPGMLAVNGAGEVYVYDENNLEGFYQRLMKFRPKVPGKYDEYEYAGLSEDVDAGKGKEPTRPVADAAGHLYTISKQGERIEAWDPSHPADPPICTFVPKKGGITAITVDPLSGELFFFSERKESGFTFKTVHQLDPCNPGTGKFGAGEVIAQVEVKPERGDLWGLAFDPVRKLSPSRAPGVLYGAAPGPEPGNGAGKGEPGLGSLGYIFAPTKENPPEVSEESVSKVGTTSAQLGATVDPKGFETRYAFQYMTEAAYQEGGETFAGATEVPPGGALLAGSGVAQGVAVTLTGLQPDTAYRWRAIATSECATGKTCEGTGEAQSFHSFPEEAAGLADKRAWELVSPALKNGGQVLPADPRIVSCNFECKPGPTWEHFPMQSSPDGEALVYEGTPFSPSEGAVRENQYIARRDAKTGWQTANLSQRGGEYKAFSADLADGVFKGGPALSPTAPPGYENFYSQPSSDPLTLDPLLVSKPPNRLAGTLKLRYAAASADLSRVFFEANDALSEETPFAPAAEDGGQAKSNLYEWERESGQLRLLNVLPGNTETKAGASFGFGSAHTVSADGSRAFFSDEAGHVFVREDAETTREIPNPAKAKFLAAATDGSRALLSDGHLYDLETETTTDLSEGKGGFQGLVGQSDDLSHAYFVDTAVLSGEEENGEGEKAQAGKNNLYAWSGGTTRFVAVLAVGDNGGGSEDLSHDWVTSPSNRTAEASPNGRFVAFLSEARLTGYDNTGPCETDHKGGHVSAPCLEAFLYDSASGEMSCASCNPSGERPFGRSMLRLINGPPSLPQPHYLTDEGRLFFDSQDSLSFLDTNEGVEDVYQYEPNEVGTCKREAGCVTLISAGHEAVDSNFLAADPSGKNVFFTTRDQLVQKDEDDLIDVYDAREGGGIPGETEVARSECQGEACQPAVVVPNDPTPGSSSFEGAGNVVEAKAKKHKKKHAKKHKSKKHNKRAAKHNRGGAR